MARLIKKTAAFVLLALIGVFAEISCGQACQYALHESLDGQQSEFGQAVDVRGDLLLVGAPDLGSNDVASRAFLYRVSDGQLIHELQDPSSSDSNAFGGAVAISPDATQVIVGDPSDSTLAGGAGQVYLFDVASGQLQQTFNIPLADTGPLFGGSFGASVAFTNDFIVVGAESVQSIGRVYLFDRQSYQLINTFDDPDPAFIPDLSGLRDLFGASVAVHSNLLVVGAPLDRTQTIFGGAAHVFDLNTGTLLETIRSPILDGGLFGGSVDISEDFIAVGARGGGVEFAFGPGRVHLFDADSFQYLRSIDAPNPASFGVSVALAGSRLIVGANLVDTALPDVGQAYVFDAETGDLIQTLDNPNPVQSGGFGFSVATDGNTIVAGSGEGLAGISNDVHLFQLDFKLGDVNRDGAVNFFDISPFVVALSIDSYTCEADLNGDQDVNFLDIAPFIEALVQSQDN